MYKPIKERITNGGNMDHLRENIIKGKFKLIEWVCECGVYFWTDVGDYYECPKCQKEVAINSIFSGNFNDEDKEKPRHEEN